MDLFNMNNKGSPLQEGETSMELDDDARHGTWDDKEFGIGAPIVEINVGHHLLTQPSTSGNNSRKRKSQSTYPFPEKVSRNAWKGRHQPHVMSVDESELFKTNADAPKFTSIVTIPGAENMLDERAVVQCPEKRLDVFIYESEFLKPSADASSFKNAVTVPDAENFLDERAVIQRLEKRDGKSALLLFSDNKDNVKADISSATASYEEVKVLEEQKKSITKKRYSCYYTDYSKKGIITCDKCEESFAQLKFFIQHRTNFHS